MRESVISLYETLDVTIPTGATGLSASIDLGGLRLAGVALPLTANWTAASVTLQVSQDGTNFFDLYVSGSEVVIDGTTHATQRRMQGLSLADMAAWPYIKLRSGTGATPVSQASGRTLTLALRPV